MKTFDMTRTSLAAVLVSVPATMVFLALALILAPGIFYVVPPDQPMSFASRFLGMLGSAEGVTMAVLLLVVIAVSAVVTTALVARPAKPKVNVAAPARTNKPASAPAARMVVTTSVAVAAGEEEGIVKWFNVNKGFGFITRPSGEEIFVHFRNIQGAGRRGLRQGQKVRYNVTEGEKGPQADQVVGLRD